MNDHSPSPEWAASTLPKGIKKAMLSDPDNVQTPYGGVVHGMIKRGLAGYQPITFLKQRLVLTDFGRAVRAVLISEQEGGSDAKDPV